MSLTTPRILAQRILRLRNQGDIPRDYKIKEGDIIPLVIDAANRHAKANHYQMRGQDVSKAVDSHYVQTYNDVDVKINNVTGQNYIDLPSSYVSLPNNAGVQRIAPLTDKTYLNKAMIPIQASEMDIFESVLGSMQKQWVYEIQGSKAFFHKRCGNTLCESEIKKVSVTLVVSIGDLHPDAPFPAPSDTHDTIIREVLELISLQIPRDEINDNNLQQHLLQ
jgi:hypothetical protein